MMKGTNTINQDMILIPLLHNRFNTTVKIIITTNFINAALYNLLKISMMTCVNENAIYKSAGGHILSKSIYYNIIF